MGLERRSRRRGKGGGHEDDTRRPVSTRSSERRRLTDDDGGDGGGTDDAGEVDDDAARSSSAIAATAPARLHPATGTAPKESTGEDGAEPDERIDGDHGSGSVAESRGTGSELGSQQMQMQSKQDSQEQHQQSHRFPPMTPRGRDASGNPAEKKRVRLRSSGIGDGDGVGGGVCGGGDRGDVTPTAELSGERIRAYFQNAASLGGGSVSSAAPSAAGEGTGDVEGGGRITTGEFMDDFSQTWALPPPAGMESGGGRSESFPSAPAAPGSGALPPSDATRMTSGEFMDQFSCAWTAPPPPPAPTSGNGDGDGTRSESPSEGGPNEPACWANPPSGPVSRGAPSSIGAGRATSSEFMEDFLKTWEEEDGVAGVDVGAERIFGPAARCGSGVVDGILAYVEDEISRETLLGLGTEDRGGEDGDRSTEAKAPEFSAEASIAGSGDEDDAGTVPGVESSAADALPPAAASAAELLPGAASSASPATPPYRDEDVLCVRGGASIHHPGNRWYHDRAAMLRSEYLGEDTPYRRKIELRDELIEAVRGRGGQFLGREAKGGCSGGGPSSSSEGRWFELPPGRIKKKVSQHLRERKPP